MEESKDEVSYSTYFLVTWTWTCIQAVLPGMILTMPEPSARDYATRNCSCVIDKYRAAVTEEELKMLTQEQRGEMGEHFAKICMGLASES